MLCADAICFDWLSSLSSLGQLIPRFFFGEREPACVSSAAIFATITHALGMDLRQKALERHGRVYTNVNLGMVPRVPASRLEVVSAPQTFWALVPHFIWGRYVYTSKMWSTVPKNGKYAVPCRLFSVCKWGFKMLCSSGI